MHVIMSLESLVFRALLNLICIMFALDCSRALLAATIDGDGVGGFVDGEEDDDDDDDKV